MTIKKKYNKNNIYKSNTHKLPSNKLNGNKLNGNNKSSKKSKKKIFRKSRKLIKMKGGNNSLDLNNISKTKFTKVKHPMEIFINKNVENKYILVFDKDNVDILNYENIYVNAFFNKLLDILNFSFAKERDYHISIGTYSQDYVYDMNNVRNNLHNPKFMTIILTDHYLQPISMLYVEKNENDFDKIWTVCTDKDYRGQGISSLILNYMIVRQLNERRDKMLLEVYNDDHINRNTDSDVLQKQIMKLFSSKGFEHKDVNTFSEHTRNNLLHRNNDTKVMVFNPDDWLKKNNDEERYLNTEGKTFCNCS